MADKIRGITIEIGGDTSGLTKALKGVNSDINTTQKQLKDVEKLLKLDPTNIDLLRQKEQLLNKQVEQTNQKLEELKKIQQTMDQNGVDKNSEQYMALQREIIATENSLKDLEKAADNSNAAMAKISATADKVAEGAQKVADKTSKLSTAAAAAVAAVAGVAYSSVTASDDLNTLAKQTGLTTEALQKMEYASDLIDVSVDDITGALKKLKKNLTSTSSDTQAAFKAIGVSIYDASGEFRDIEEIFNDCLVGLSNIGNETERDTLAMTIFGKSADSLAGIIDDGGAALAEYGEQAEQLGLILSQDTLDSLNEVNDKIDTIKANFKATLAEVGAEATEALLPVVEKVLAAISKLLRWLGSLNEVQIETGLIIMSLVAAIPVLTSVITALSTAISFICANPIVALIALIGTLIALLAVSVSRLMQYKEVLHQVFVEDLQNIINKAKALVTAFVYKIVQLVKLPINAVIDMANVVIDVLNALIGHFNKVLSLVGGKMQFSTLGKIPYLAKGGILSSGSAIVGEAGPELLTMLGNKAMVQPLTANVDMSGVQKAISGMNTNTNVNIEFTGSLSQLGVLLQPVIKQETIRRGGSLINA